MKQIHYTVMLTGIISFGFFTICAASGIHKLVDEHGRIIFTNNATQVSTKIRSQKSGVTVSSHQINSVIGNYPKISKVQQDQRDIKRRQILSQELANETRLLEDALKTIDLTLQKTENYLPSHPYFVSSYFDILQLRNQAASHERNIKALNAELNNL